MRMVVDLPAPFGPSTPKISPRRTVSETSRTATSVAEATREVLGVDHHVGHGLAPPAFL